MAAKWSSVHVLRLCDLESVEETQAASVLPSANGGSNTEQGGDGEDGVR